MRPFTTRPAMCVCSRCASGNSGEPKKALVLFFGLPGPMRRFATRHVRRLQMRAVVRVIQDVCW